MTKANPSRTGAGAGTDGTSPRARFRGQIRDEAKSLALGQLAAGGPQALSLNAIAKSLGMSGPALYRYFANREALLTDLIVDAYQDLAAALGTAVAVPGHQPHDRLADLAAAYRAWALDQPHRYRLLFRAPLYDYDPQSPALVDASRPAMAVTVSVLTPLVPPGRPAANLVFHATSLWAGLHGLVSLEIEGNFTSMGLDPLPLYEAQVTAVQHAVAS